MWELCPCKIVPRPVLNLVIEKANTEKVADDAFRLYQAWNKAVCGVAIEHLDELLDDVVSSIRRYPIQTSIAMYLTYANHLESNPKVWSSTFWVNSLL